MKTHITMINQTKNQQTLKKQTMTKQKKHKHRKKTVKNHDKRIIYWAK